MMEYSAKPPTIPIPFHKLLKVVALVDADNPETSALIERLEAEKFEVEVSDRYHRDVLEDAAVGAYTASIDGDKLEPARKLVRAVRAAGFATPLCRTSTRSR
jgi:ornithine decarboxylase